ncbi:DUF2510 domain-containing protein [Microbacterium sp. NPDC003461]
MSTNTPSTPAGWYPSERTGQLRYWDGAQWTEHYQPAAPAQPAPPQPAAPQQPAAQQPAAWQQPAAQAPEAGVPGIPSPQQFAATGRPAAYGQAPSGDVPAAAPGYGQAPAAAGAPYGQASAYDTAAPTFAGTAPAPGRKKGLGKGAIAGIVAGAVVVAGAAVWGGVVLFGGLGGAGGCPTPDAALFDGLTESGGAEGVSAAELADASALSPDEIQSLFGDACVYTASGEIEGALGSPATGEMTIALSSDGAVDPASVADTFEAAGWSDLGALAALGGEDTGGMGMWIEGDMASLITSETTAMTMAIGMEFEAAKEQMSDEELKELESRFPGLDYMLVVVTTSE